MRLTDTEKAVYLAAQLRAKDPISKIARRAKVKEHVVRYVLNKLTQNNIIKKRAVINTHRLGFIQYSAYLNIWYESEKRKQNLLKIIRDADEVVDLFELGGDYQLGIVQRAKEVESFYLFWSRISKLKGIRIQEKAVTNRIATSIFERSYLSEQQCSRKEITYRKKHPIVKLDELDWRVIQNINMAHHTSVRDFARQLGVPHSTLQQRICRLESEGAIIDYIYGMQVHKIGMQSYRLLVYTRGFNSRHWDILFKLAMSEPNVLVLTHCIGSWDFEMVVEVERAASVQRIVGEVYQALGVDVVTIKTIPLFRFLKAQHSAYHLRE
jgi:DNA-binding Lrp family transcriptional regulator